MSHLKTYTRYLPEGSAFFKWDGQNASRCYTCAPYWVTYRVRRKAWSCRAGADLLLIDGVVCGGLPIRSTLPSGARGRLEIQEIVEVERAGGAK